MNRVKKIMLIFSIVYWLLVAMGAILTGLAFEKVPIGYYGLRAYHFSSKVDTNYYTNGLYHAGVGYDFVLYPRTKQYLVDQQITVTNKDL
jgi:hypothetical protein